MYVSGGPADYQSEPAEREITVHDILTQLSGLSTGFSVGPVGDIYRSYGITFSFRGMDLADYCDLLASMPLSFQPGTRWLYSSATDVVGRVVEVVSGMTLDRYFDEHIFGPLRMTDTAFFVPEDKQERFAQNYTQSREGLKPLPSIGKGSAGPRPTRSAPNSAGRSTKHCF